MWQVVIMTAVFAVFLAMEAFLWLWCTGTTATAVSLFGIRLAEEIRSPFTAFKMSLIGPGLSSS